VAHRLEDCIVELDGSGDEQGGVAAWVDMLRGAAGLGLLTSWDWGCSLETGWGLLRIMRLPLGSSRWLVRSVEKGVLSSRGDLWLRCLDKRSRRDFAADVREVILEMAGYPRQLKEDSSRGVARLPGSEMSAER
jgi:hypothetical protein